MNHDCHKFGNHFLNVDDEEFLTGKKDLEYGSAANRRTMARERLRCALYDLTLLSESLPTWNVKSFARGVNPETDRELYNGIISAISLLYSIVDESDVDTEVAFTDGVRKSTWGMASEVNVQIDVEYPDEFHPGRVVEKVKGGELPTPWEIGMLFYHGYDELPVTYGEETAPIRDMIQEFAENRDTETDALHVFDPHDIPEQCVVSALEEIGPATVPELTAYDEVDAKASKVREALMSLKSKDVVTPEETSGETRYHLENHTEWNVWR